MKNTQRIDERQLNGEVEIGVWLIQRDARVVFVCRAMWKWIESFDKKSLKST